MREDQSSTMERDASFSSDPTSMRRHHHPVLPPWEVRSVSQVPFIEPGSPPLARRDDQGFFAMGSTPRAIHRPKLSATISAPCGSEYSSPVEQSSSYPWKEPAPVPHGQVATQSSYETPASRGPTHYRPPYEDPNNSKPVFRKAASQPPPTFVPQAPPTPPDSVSRCSVRSTSASPPLRPASKALPGTMSSRATRNRSASHHQTKSHTKSLPREDITDHHEAKPDQVGLGKRFKSAFRDIFKKDPVDDSQFERISDRHWTDEY